MASKICFASKICVASAFAGLVLLSVARIGSAQQQQPSVTIEAYAFRPTTLSVPAETVVTFENADDTTHSITASDASFRSSPLASGGKFQVTFKKPGTFTYFCGFHPFMEGRVVVVAKGGHKPAS